MNNFKEPKLVKLNRILTKRQQQKAMEFIADKANKRGPFESEDLFEYILKIGIERDYAFYLIQSCFGFEYIEKLLND